MNYKARYIPICRTCEFYTGWYCLHNLVGQNGLKYLEGAKTYRSTLKTGATECKGYKLKI